MPMESSVFNKFKRGQCIMPNWTTTSYVFRSKEKGPIEEFRNKLLNWTQNRSLLKSAWDGSPYWLGNILLNAGFQ